MHTFVLVVCKKYMFPFFVLYLPPTLLRRRSDDTSLAQDLELLLIQIVHAWVFQRRGLNEIRELCKLPFQLVNFLVRGDGWSVGAAYGMGEDKWREKSSTFCPAALVVRR